MSLIIPTIVARNPNRQNCAPQKPRDRISKCLHQEKKKEKKMMFKVIN